MPDAAAHEAAPAWVPVTAEQARTHPQYGLFKRGLLGITCLLLYGFVRELQGAASAWNDPVGWPGAAWIDTATRYSEVVALGVDVAFIFAWFAHWRAARTGFGLLIGLQVLFLVPLAAGVVVILNQGVPFRDISGVLAILGVGLLINLVVRCAIWQFMGRSPAYRVTFEHLVRPDDPILAAPAPDAPRAGLTAPRQA